MINLSVRTVSNLFDGKEIEKINIMGEGKKKNVFCFVFVFCGCCFSGLEAQGREATQHSGLGYQTELFPFDH